VLSELNPREDSDLEYCAILDDVVSNQLQNNSLN
jgi:hypothetical protein